MNVFAEKILTMFEPEEDEIVNHPEETEKKTKATENFYYYHGFPCFIFKQDGVNKGWIQNSDDAQCFLADFATEFEDQHKTSDKVKITRETSKDKNTIKIFSEDLDVWYGKNEPVLISTLEIEKLDQID